MFRGIPLLPEGQLLSFFAFFLKPRICKRHHVARPPFSHLATIFDIPGVAVRSAMFVFLCLCYQITYRDSVVINALAAAVHGLHCIINKAVTLLNDRIN